MSSRSLFPEHDIIIPLFPEHSHPKRVRRLRDTPTPLRSRYKEPLPSFSAPVDSSHDPILLFGRKRKAA